MRRIIGILVVAGALLTSGLLSAQGGTQFKVVVHSSNPASSLSKLAASRYFLKKVTKWDNGKKIEPVDQVEKSTVRQKFSKAVHAKDVAWIKSYWQKLFFSGRATAPPELASDSEVLSYVRSRPGAVGYVSSGTAVGEGLKVVDITP